MKICFILPQLSARSDSHYFHIQELIQKLAEKNQIFVLAESGDANFHLKNTQSTYVITTTFTPLSIILRLYYLIKIRLAGCTKFYIHYSQISSLLAIITTKLTGGQTYLWNCVQEHLYFKPDVFSFLTHQLPITLSLKLTDHLITCTPQMKKYFHQQFQLPLKKIHTIPNFICLQRFHPSRKSKTKLKQHLKIKPLPTLLYVHSLSHRKGADRLIEYGQIIKDKKYKLQILIIGDGPLQEKINKAIKSHQLEHQLILKGPVPNAQILPYFQASDIFIMPSRQEEFGRVQLEAMATGLPIIATQTKSSQFVLNQHQRSLVVLQSQYTKIVTLAHELVKSKTQHQKFKSVGFKQVQRFTLDQAAKQFSHLFLTT